MPLNYFFFSNTVTTSDNYVHGLIIPRLYTLCVISTLFYGLETRAVEDDYVMRLEKDKKGVVK